jgi:hypothetical protein
MAEPHEIDRATFKTGVTQTVTELHLTGGVRAVQDGDRLWSWYPVLESGRTKALAPMPINRIDSLASDVWLTLFGGDQQSCL